MTSSTVPWGNNILSGGEGNDILTGRWGIDTFIFDGGHDNIRDFDPGFDWWLFSRPGDQITFEIDGVDSFDYILANTIQDGRNVVIELNEEDSLTLRNTWISELESDSFAFV